jgi:hypothetical protein
VRFTALVIILLGACASAGKNDGSVDAAPRDDARPVDVATSDATTNGCSSTDTCAAATMLGSVSGDTGNMKLNTSGDRAAWIRVRVTEDNNSINGLTLRVAAKLTSPAAANFDVFVYVNASSDVVECSTTTGTTTMNGPTETNRSEWGEGAIPNGSSDSRNVSIEIRPISGMCSAGQMWQLEVEGNWI